MNRTKGDTRHFYTGAPVSGPVGRTMPLYLEGPDFEEVEDNAITTGYTSLTYSTVHNTVASVVIPGEAGGNAVLLSYESEIESVQPGSTYTFPIGVSSFQISGNGLSVYSQTGFIFTSSGVVDIQLSVEVGSNLTGDFNNDGLVDAADYTVWRDGFADEYSQGDYHDWKAHFGQTVENGSEGIMASVPEPPTALLFCIAGVATLLLHRR
jgi:hypothetical protein